MMTLYIAHLSASLAPLIVAHEANLSLTIRSVDIRTTPPLYKSKGELTYSPSNDYTAINSQGYVPALVMENGEIWREGIAITTYLADLKPEAKLMPPHGSKERYRVLELQSFIATELHQKIYGVFRPYLAENAKDEFRKVILSRLAELEAILSDARKYLTGEDFTAADAYLFTFLGWLNNAKINISHLTTLLAFKERVASRPAVQDALKEDKEASTTA